MDAIVRLTALGCVRWRNYAESVRLEAFGRALWRFAAARFARLYPLDAAVLLLGFVVTSWDDLDAGAQDGSPDDSRPVRHRIRRANGSEISL